MDETEQQDVGQEELKETIIEIMAVAVDFFNNDLIEFAERNWCPSQVEMLKSAIECVQDGKTEYAPIEEDK